MNKNFIPLTAAAYLAMTAVYAADPGALMPPNRYGAPHKMVLPAVSSHNAGVTPETAAASDAVAFNVHVALWRSFDVKADFCGTQPMAINDLGEITRVATRTAFCAKPTARP